MKLYFSFKQKYLIQMKSEYSVIFHSGTDRDRQGVPTLKGVITKTVYFGNECQVSDLLSVVPNPCVQN